MRYTYSIERINKEDRWVFLTSNDVWDLEEPDSFVFLLKKIRDRVGGPVMEAGEMRYIIPADGLGLNYQWDTLFGITVVYPQTAQVEAVIDFLLSFNEV